MNIIYLLILNNRFWKSENYPRYKNKKGSRTNATAYRNY